MCEKVDSRPLYNEAPKRQETVNRLVIPENVQEALQRSEWHVLLLRHKLGDTIMASAIVHGLREVKKLVRNPHGIQLYALPQHIDLLYQFLSLPEITALHTSETGMGRNHSRAVCDASDVPLHIAFNFSSMHLPNSDHPEAIPLSLTSRYKAQGRNPNLMYEIQDLGQRLVWGYSTEYYQETRFAALTEDLVGFERGTINSAKAQPRIVLPVDHEERSRRLLQEAQVDPTLPYVVLIPQVGKGRTLYPLAYWGIIANKLLESGYQVAMLIDKDNETKGSEEIDVTHAMQQMRVEERIHYFSGTLLDIASFSKNAAFFIGSDTGPSHLLLAIPDGPKGATLHITTPAYQAKYWRSSWEKQLPFESDFLRDIDPRMVVTQTVAFANTKTT